MTGEAQDLLTRFFEDYAAAVSSANPGAFTDEFFDHSLLSDTDRLLPFMLEKSDQRALARSDRERKARADDGAITFELLDMVGFDGNAASGQIYVTVGWHMNVSAIARKAGEADAVVGYVLRLDGGRIDILAAARLDEAAVLDAATEEPDAPVLQDRLPPGHGNRGPGYIAG